jgi:hypothetical protein
MTKESEVRLPTDIFVVPTSSSRKVAWGQDSSVGIATGYGLDGRGVGLRVMVVERFFFSPRRPDWFWGPPSLLYNGYQGLFPREGVKRAGREADHSPRTSAEVKNPWICTSTPPYVFMSWGVYATILTIAKRIGKV